jgi:shikimate 5-dehydrogenase
VLSALDLQAELLDAVSHLIAIDAEELSGLTLTASGALERLGQELPFDVIEVDALLAGAGTALVLRFV